MRKITIAIYICLLIWQTKAPGQCPATVPTFSINSPSATAGRTYLLSDAIRNTAGELVGIGIKQEAGATDWHVYFAKYNSNGQFIGVPQRITPTSGSLPVSYNFIESKTAFITEAFDATGNPNGYMIAVNTSLSLDKDIWVARLDPGGCVVWSRRLGFNNDGVDEIARGIFRSGTDNYAILAVRNPNNFGNMVIHEMDGAGAACTSHEFATGFEPLGMTPLTPGAFGNAVWAVCGDEYANYGGKPGFVLLDAGFQEINGIGDVFDPDVSDPDNHHPIDLVQVGSSLFVIGATASNSGKGWLMKLSWSQSTPGVDLAYDWSKIIDWPDDPGFFVQYDVPWDIEAKNDTLAIGGWSYWSDPSLPYRPWLMTIKNDGTLLQSKRLTHSAAQFGILHKVINLPNQGYYLAGQQWNNLGQSGGTQAYAARCDNNLVIGSCMCNADQLFQTPDIMGAFEGLIDFPLNSVPCQNNAMTAQCIADDNSQQVCFQPPISNNCEVIIQGINPDPCMGSVQFSAQVTGMGSLVTYSWDFGNGTTGTGDSPTALYTFPANYQICVTASDGVCSATYCTNINVALDNIAPIAVCQSAILASLDAAGTASITVSDVDNGSFDDCPFTMSLDRDMFSCADLGLNTVTLTVTDLLGNFSICTAQVDVVDKLPPTIMCPAPQTIIGMPSPAGECFAQANNLTPILSDNCPPPSYSYVFSGATMGSGVGDASGSFFAVGLTTVTYTAVDGSGNTANCTVDITVLPCPFPGDFEKIYGDTAYSVPTRVKAFSDGVYVAGQTRISGQTYATFSKFDINNGTLIFDFRLDFPSTITDFEYEPSTDELILVGYTEPFQVAGIPQNNESIIFKINDNGVIQSVKRMQQTGREFFQKIIRHPFPKDPAFPYYILGTRNTPASPSPPSSVDVVVVFNADQNLNFKPGCPWQYDYNIDDEFHRGLIALANGDLILLGNDSPDGYGIMVRINGLNGNIIAGSKRTNLIIDIYDGVELPSGQIAIAGSNFGNNEAFIALLTADLNFIYALRIPEIIDFREIGIDNVGRLYSIGQVKDLLSEKYNIIQRYVVSGALINLQMSKYMEDDPIVETDYTLGHIAVTPGFNRIFYADGRKNTPSGFGDHDMLVGNYDLDLTASCAYDYPINPIIFGNLFTLDITPTKVNTLPVPPNSQLSAIPIPYLCNDFCTPDCLASFGWQGGCALTVFNSVGNGTPPLTYSWDFNGDNIEDANVFNPTYTFPGAGIYTVCLTITDALGCVVEVCNDVQVPADNTLFQLNCPPDITVNTDPGVCGAALNPQATTIDDCLPDPVIFYQLTGATTGTNPATFYNKGLTTLTATAVDGINTLTCTTLITVIDNEPPQISCQAPPPVNAPICDGGANVSFNPPTISDNCPMVTYTCSHTSGQFFPCGTTMVTCTATDMSGNTSTCTFPVTVNCTCGAITSAQLSCTDDPYLYAFSLEVQDLSGAASCGLSIVNNQSGTTTLNISSISAFSGGFATITGTIAVSDPIPSQINLTVQMSCICPLGNTINCDLPIALPTDCCKEVSVLDWQVCKDETSFDVPIEVLGTLNNISRVKWYVQPAPCPALPWGITPFQDNLTNTLEPLHLNPASLTGDVCVYVVVELNDAPCSQLVSNVATINLCETPTCSINDQEYCYTGSPITPGLLTLTPASTDCNFEIAWYDPNGNLVQTGGLTYQPTQSFSHTNPLVDCYQDYHYRVVITDLCGQQECFARIRLYSNDAPKGNISMDPFELQPFCPGEDATLVYDPGCAGEPPMWNWWSSIDDITYLPISGAGSSNPLWHTNSLNQDTWFMVTSQNGVCAADTVKLLIDVRQPLTISQFSAQPDPPCDPIGVSLYLEYVPYPDADCNTTIKWYKDGILIHITPAPAGSPAVFNYTSTSLAGNYFAVISNDCCGEEVTSLVNIVGPPCFAKIVGPCFRCNDQQITLTGMVVNLPPGSVCSYQWSTTDGIIISGDNTDQVVVNAGGTYLFTANCNGCIKTASFELPQCVHNTSGCGILVEVIDPADVKGLPLLAMPNPTSGELTVAWGIELPVDARIAIIDALGNTISTEVVPRRNTLWQTQLQHLPSGVYFIEIQATGYVFKTLKIVKE